MYDRIGGIPRIFVALYYPSAIIAIVRGLEIFNGVCVEAMTAKKKEIEGRMNLLYAGTSPFVVEYVLIALFIHRVYCPQSDMPLD